MVVSLWEWFRLSSSYNSVRFSIFSEPWYFSVLLKLSFVGMARFIILSSQSFFPLRFILFIIVCGFVHFSAGIHRGWKRTSGLLELES